MSERIRLAIQKKGRLTEDCRKIFEKSGLTFKDGERQLIYSVPEMPIDLIFVRDDDIPSLVSKGTCDFGIVGLNVFEETKYEENGDFQADVFARLGIAKCRLAIAVPENSKYETLADLNGKKIATTYPRIVKNFLKNNNISAGIVHLSGSVELGPAMHLADLIVDIVSSGATLVQNNLKEVGTILESEAVLINNKGITAEKKEIAERFMTRVRSSLRVSRKRYVILNAPKTKVEEISKLLPGSESPTIIPLLKEDMVSLHALCDDNQIWNTIEKLKAAGASSIATLQLEIMLD